jgi:hypothetical protein
MKLNLLLATLLLLGAVSSGCQDMDPNSDANKAKLAEDVATRPASRRWFWWGGEAEQPAPGANPAPAAPAATPPAPQG